MTTLAKVRKAAAAVGATVEDEKIGRSHECRVLAPRGKVWKCCGVHELVECVNIPWKPSYPDVLGDIEFGLEDCPDSDCEVCEE